MAKMFVAGMYFHYGKQKRPGVLAETTFEAILSGERISTTRFDVWKGSDRWKLAQPGDTIRFYDSQDLAGRCVIVTVERVTRINLSEFTDEQYEEWSRVEGWSVKHARSLAALGAATQIIYSNPQLQSG